MGRPDAIEFHLGHRVLLEVESSHAPDRGDKVNIGKQTYAVVGRSYTVDYAFDGPARTQTVCIISLEPTEPTP